MNGMNRKYYPLLLFVACLLLTACQPGIGIAQFFERFNFLAGDFQRLITGITYLIGLMFAYRAVYALKLYGEARTMMSNHANVKAPAIYTFVAAVFLYLPTAVGTVNQAIFGDGTPLGYSSLYIDHTRLYLTGILAFIRVIGLISFIRGWIYLAALAQQGGHQNSSGKALTHIVGGVLAYNIEATLELLHNSF